jgi:NAD(P)-dependent dehydrogenase (short-subunit alcohol dehydrogenase family)
MGGPLTGRVALVAGGTRAAGRGIAVQLGAAGATVYVTGRTTRSERSEMNRPETIEETAELVDEAGGQGIAVQVDHLVPDQVQALVARIERDQGALHVLVNDIWGATTMEWGKSVWERVHRPRRQPARRLGVHHRSPGGGQGCRRVRLPVSYSANGASPDPDATFQR